MSDINVDPNAVIESLSQQVAAQARDIAILNAMVSQLRKALQEASVNKVVEISE
jgi:uncharacterized coiled-coil protein SlyX